MDEHGPQPGVGVGLERGVREAVVGSDVRPVDDGGDPRLGRAQQADQRGGVDVLGPEVIAELPPASGARRSKRRRRGSGTATVQA